MNYKIKWSFIMSGNENNDVWASTRSFLEREGVENKECTL